jgi:hypothetical protein
MLSRESAERLLRDAGAGVQGGDPCAELLLDCARGRLLWPTNPREALRSYLRALDQLLEALDPENYADLSTPLAEASAALADLVAGRSPPWWLKPGERQEDKPRDRTPIVMRRVAAVVGLDLMLELGVAAAGHAERQIAQAVASRVAEVRSWRQQTRRGDRSESEMELYKAMAAWMRAVLAADLAKVLPEELRAVRLRELPEPWRALLTRSIPHNLKLLLLDREPKQREEQTESMVREPATPQHES